MNKSQLIDGGARAAELFDEDELERYAAAQKKPKAPAVQKMLLNELNRLKTENAELGDYREQFHAADKKLAVEEQRGKQRRAGEVIFGVCLTIGAAAIGRSPAVWGTVDAWLYLVFGFFLLIAGVVFRSMQR